MMNKDKLLLEATRYSEYTREMAQHWIGFIEHTRTTTLDSEQQLRAVNEWANRAIHYATDQSAWGENDKWTTPLELFSKGQGDCEDIAILKMITLLDLGWEPELVRLHYVKARMGGESVAHMVIGVHNGEDPHNPLILDCLISSIRPMQSRRDLEPVYAFNMHELWVNGELMEDKHPRASMGKWDAVLNKIEEELY